MEDVATRPPIAAPSSMLPTVWHMPGGIVQAVPYCMTPQPCSQTMLGYHVVTRHARHAGCAVVWGRAKWGREQRGVGGMSGGCQFSYVYCFTRSSRVALAAPLISQGQRGDRTGGAACGCTRRVLGTKTHSDHLHTETDLGALLVLGVGFGGGVWGGCHKALCQLNFQGTTLSTRAVLNGKKKLFRNMVFSKTTACSSYVQP